MRQTLLVHGLILMDDLLHCLPKPDGQGLGENLVVRAEKGHRALVLYVLEVSCLRQECDDGPPGGQWQGTSAETLIEDLLDVLSEDVPEGLVELHRESIDTWGLSMLHCL